MSLQTHTAGERPKVGAINRRISPQPANAPFSDLCAQEAQRDLRLARASQAEQAGNASCLIALTRDNRKNLVPHGSMQKDNGLQMKERLRKVKDVIAGGIIFFGNTQELGLGRLGGRHQILAVFNTAVAE